MPDHAPKNIYFVRHGQSEANALLVHQPDDVPLSPEGIRQADILAERFSRIDVDVIFSSNLTRARETAEAIASLEKKDIIVSELFREHKRASEVIGLSYDDPEAVRIHKLIYEHRNDPTWHYSDEENFHDVKKRILQGIDTLEARPERNILVVSHGHAIRLFIALLVFRPERVTHDVFEAFASFCRKANTGLSLCRQEKDGRWRLITWNDHSHLG